MLKAISNPNATFLKARRSVGHEIWCSFSFVDCSACKKRVSWELMNVNRVILDGEV